MFQSSTIIRELVLNLAKVIFMLKHSVKLCPYRLCGGVAACHRAECVLCVVQNETEFCRLCGGVAACLGVACVLCVVCCAE
jgi:hypothetical protein